MAYMNADTSAKVGYRPYAQTDPYAASQLSGIVRPVAGMGTYHLNRPFDPWELYADVHETAGLHGLGQQHPFKATAWQLHGLGDDNGNAGNDDQVAQAIQELQAAGAISADDASQLMNGTESFNDVLGYDPTDQGAWYNLVQQARAANQTLSQKEQAYLQAAPQHPGDQAFADLGRQLSAMRAQYTDTTQKLVQYYTLVMGQAPTGLSGLGIAPLVYFAAGAITFLVGAYLIYKQIQNNAGAIDVSRIAAQNTQAQVASTASTNQQLLAQLAAAQAKGDTVTAQAILKTLAVTGAAPQSTGIEAWLMSNAKWIGLGAAGLIVLGPLSEGLFGKRRR